MNQNQKCPSYMTPEYADHLERTAAQLGDDLHILHKYNRPGIYCWKIDGKIVYIGKAENMLKRLASHVSNIDLPDGIKEAKSHKYSVMREAIRTAHTVGFDVLAYCEKDELLRQEAELINRYLPALNTQIPYLDKKGYRYNGKAKTITLAEVIAQPNCYRRIWWRNEEAQK